MKIENIDCNKRHILISLDFWEVECLGYDVKKQKDVTGHYAQQLTEMIDDLVIKYFGNDYQYGVKTTIDKQKGVYFYEIMPYDERVNEFIFSEMKKEGRKWIMYRNRIWLADD